MEIKEREKIRDILSLAAFYFKGNQYTLKKYVARGKSNLKYIAFSSKNAHPLTSVQASLSDGYI